MRNTNEIIIITKSKAVSLLELVVLKNIAKHFLNLSWSEQKTAVDSHTNPITMRLEAEFIKQDYQKCWFKFHFDWNELPRTVGVWVEKQFVGYMWKLSDVFKTKIKRPQQSEHKIVHDFLKQRGFV